VLETAPGVMVVPSERAGVERGLPVSRQREGGTLASIELSTSELERASRESLRRDRGVPYPVSQEGWDAEKVMGT
jgi:hypothetical protein